MNLEWVVQCTKKREKAVEMQYILMELPETEEGQNPIESKMW